LPYSFGRVLNVLSSTNNVSILDPNFARFHLLKHVSEKDVKKKVKDWDTPRGFIEVEADLAFPFPMNEPRKFYHLIGYDYDPQSQTV
jgi:hypothetical protein